MPTSDAAPPSPGSPPDAAAATHRWHTSARGRAVHPAVRRPICSRLCRAGPSTPCRRADSASEKIPPGPALPAAARSFATMASVRVGSSPSASSASASHRGPQRASQRAAEKRDPNPDQTVVRSQLERHEFARVTARRQTHHQRIVRWSAHDVRRAMRDFHAPVAPTNRSRKRVHLQVQSCPGGGAHFEAILRLGSHRDEHRTASLQYGRQLGAELRRRPGNGATCAYPAPRARSHEIEPTLRRQWLSSGCLVHAVFEHEVIEVLRRRAGDRDQRAELHQQAAVSIDDDHFARRLRQREPQSDRRCGAHAADDVQVVRDSRSAAPVPPRATRRWPARW